MITIQHMDCETNGSKNSAKHTKYDQNKIVRGYISQIVEVKLPWLTLQ
jgi:hypothetical protein